MLQKCVARQVQHSCKLRGSNSGGDSSYSLSGNLPMNMNWHSRVVVALLLLARIPTIHALSAVRVINDGIPGQNSAEIDSRTQEDLKRFKPQIVVLFVGMNDAVNDREFLSPEQTKSHVAEIARQSHAAGALVYLITVHQPDTVRLLERHELSVYQGISPAQRIDAVNRALNEVAQEDHLKIADFHRKLEKAGGANRTLSTDGVHLSAAGYALLASTVREVLPKKLRTGTILCLGDSLTYGIGVRQAGDPQEGADTYPAQLRRLLSEGIPAGADPR